MLRLQLESVSLMSTIILADRGEEGKIIEEEREEWVYQVLVALGVEEDVLVENSNEVVLEYCKSIGIEVIKNLGEDTISIFKNRNLVAEWKVPNLIFKKEGKEYFYEIHLNEWALPFQQIRRGEK